MDYEYHIYRIIGTIPTYAMILVGIVFALRSFPKHPRSSGILLAALVLDGGANLLLPFVMQTAATTIQQLGLFNAANQQGLWALVWTLPFSLVSALIWGLILFAVFDRPDPPKFLQEDDQDRDLLDE